MCKRCTFNLRIRTLNWHVQDVYSSKTTERAWTVCSQKNIRRDALLYHRFLCDLESYSDRLFGCVVIKHKIVFKPLEIWVMSNNEDTKHFRLLKWPNGDIFPKYPSPPENVILCLSISFRRREMTTVRGIGRPRIWVRYLIVDKAKHESLGNPVFTLSCLKASRWKLLAQLDHRGSMEIGTRNKILLQKQPFPLTIQLT